MDDGAYELAVEQYVFWRGQGLTHSEMLAAVGIKPPPWRLDAEMVVQHLAAAERDRAASIDPKNRTVWWWRGAA